MTWLFWASVYLLVFVVPVLVWIAKAPWRDDGR